ncbi:MAG: hypothetical protein JNL58_17115 [Planctomyces sp.]|nr:hypothetical protein [Planctomyces sp.]
MHVKQARIRHLIRDHHGMESLQSVLILAVAAMVLLGLKLLWNPGSSGGEGMMAGVTELFETIFNGGTPTENNGGTETGGNGSNGGGENNGTGGAGGGGENSGPGGPGGPEGPGGEGGQGGNEGTGNEGTGGEGNGSGDGTGTGEEGGPDGGDKPGDDKKPEDDKKRDDGRVDPLDADFAKALAKAVAENAKEKRLSAVAGLVTSAEQNLAKSSEIYRVTELATEAARNTPDLPLADKIAMENQLSKTRIDMLNARIAVDDAKAGLDFVKTQTERFSRAVGVMGAVDTLMEADRKRQELVANGQYAEAWRVTVGGTTRYITEVATSFTDKLPGVKGSLASEVFAATAEVAGRQLADDTFPAMVDISHWLYEKPWWPKNRRPRFPRGYDPANDPTQK